MGYLWSALNLGAALAISGLFAQVPRSLQGGGDDQFHLARVGYIMLGVADLKVATAFYRDKLGLKITGQTDDVVFFDTGTVSLVISTAVGREPGATEIVFTVDHVQPAYAALSHQGLHFERPPHLVTGTSWAANFRDPDGHILSLFGPE
ncbi:MAG TPA: VOC family protein [Bryobacteraceae bacterium]|nr:VOC family protein [Bryobacteraceae bacterium]